VIVVRNRLAPFALLALCAGACTPAPVRAFESFYAATVAKDAHRVRGQLCAEGRAQLAAIDDVTLLASWSVLRVVRRATLTGNKPTQDGVVAVHVEDALGGSTTVHLREDPDVPAGWCILSVLEEPPTTTPGASR
jgi:hypothetical protein